MTISCVNGFVCFTCGDVEKARQGINPAMPASARAGATPGKTEGTPLASASSPGSGTSRPVDALPAPGTGLLIDRRA